MPESKMYHCPECGGYLDHHVEKEEVEIVEDHAVYRVKCNCGWKGTMVYDFLKIWW